MKNLPDGSVAVMACGEQDRVELYCGWLRLGPEMAVVSDVRFEDMKYEHFQGFVVK